MKNRRTSLARRATGFSLVELLVAMTIMILLGGALVTILKQGIDTWHLAEKRSTIYERARGVLDQVSDDLRSAAGDARAEGAGFWIRFICDADGQGPARLRFVRAIPESQDPVAREGGRFLETFGGVTADQHGDAIKVRDGQLLPPAGYQEVLYAMDPDPGAGVLWRGIRMPIGGAGSFFIDRNVDEEPSAAKDRLKKAPSANGTVAKKKGAKAQSAEAAGTTGEKAPAPKAAPGVLARAARPFTRGIIHLSFAFWTPFTNTWDQAKPPKVLRSALESSGPILTWDSTRASLDEKAGGGEFAWRRIEGSLEDPTDDVFPQRVEVTLVTTGNADIPEAVLVEDLGLADRTVALSRTQGLSEEGPNRFVWIEGEWIGYERIEANRLILPAGKGAGRGARGTRPAAHLRGAGVDAGTTFRRVVEIPAGRVDALLSRPVEKGGRP